MTPGDYWTIVKRRKWSLMLPAFIIILVAAAVALLLPPVYRSTATILIEEQDVPQDFVMTTVTSYAEQRIQQINQRIMSVSKLLEIIQRFDLYPDLRDKWTTEEIVEKMREDTRLVPISAEIIDRRTGRPGTATIAFSLSYEGEYASKVQQVANTLTSLFLEENLKERVKQVEETSEFLGSEMRRVKEELNELTARIATFKESHISELPEMLQVNQQSLHNIERNIETTNEQLRALRERQGYLSTQLASIDPYLKKDEEQVTRQRLENLKVELVALTKRFTEEYPDVKKTRAEIADLEDQLAQIEANKKSSGYPPDNPAYINLSAQLASTNTDIQSMRRRVEELQVEAEKFRLRIGATPRVEDQYRELTVALDNTQAKYNDLMTKHMEAKMAHGLEKEQKGERFTLIDPPLLPEKPVKPNRLAIALIGLVLGIGAGVGFAALKEFSDDAVHDADKLTQETGIEVLVGIPVIKTTRDTRVRRFKRISIALGTLGATAAGIAVFHFFVMDLNVFWAKIIRRLAL